MSFYTMQETGKEVLTEDKFYSDLSQYLNFVSVLKTSPILVWNKVYKESYFGIDDRFKPIAAL